MITGIYASLLVILYFVLTWRVIKYRRANRIGLGDDGDKSLLKRMRAHANFMETVPFALILILVLELQQTLPVLLHLLGILLVAGRTLHAIGFSASPPIMPLRFIGMASTLGVIGTSGVLLFWTSIVS